MLLTNRERKTERDIMHLFTCLLQCIEFSSVSRHLQLQHPAPLLPHISLSCFYYPFPCTLTLGKHSHTHTLTLVTFKCCFHSEPRFPTVSLCFFFANAPVSALFFLPSILPFFLPSSLQRGISVGQVPCHGLWLYNVCFCLSARVLCEPGCLLCARR